MKTSREENKSHLDNETNIEPTAFCLQNRGKSSDQFAKKILSVCNIETAFTTRKLKTSLPYLKGKFEYKLCSRVVYQLTCSRCNARYVGQSVRHLTTRLKEHVKDSSPVGMDSSPVTQCELDRDVNSLKVEILDECTGKERLLILEALYISKTQPTINIRKGTTNAS